MKLKNIKQWHLLVFILCAILAVASWVIAIYYWGKLPPTIPTHFGFSGMADSWGQKSIWYVFMIPTLQALMLIGFGFLYFKPQYTSMPTTMLLMSLEKKKRDYAFDLIRNMLIVTLLLLGIFFTYLTYGMNYSALHVSVGLLPQVMIAWIVTLVAWLIFYNVKVYRVTKKFLGKVK
ncbi:MAG: DUF1648 domain-containing protein [Prolixibacteraceae bacterium]|nr:DUF1648 domain-containing protein [Prolixibacteraceae bacterium]